MQPPAVRVVLALLALAVAACAGSRERPRSQTPDSSALPDCSDVVGDKEESAVDPPEEVPEPDVDPVARNDQEVVRALKENYPSELKERGRGGVVVVWIRIRDDGRVDSVTVAQSSAPASFDEAAKEVARVMRFAPALDAEGDPMVTWVQRCITFAVS